MKGAFASMPAFEVEWHIVELGTKNGDESVGRFEVDPVFIISGGLFKGISQKLSRHPRWWE